MCGSNKPDAFPEATNSSCVAEWEALVLKLHWRCWWQGWHFLIDGARDLGFICLCLDSLIICWNAENAYIRSRPRFWKHIFHSYCLENKFWSCLVSKLVIYYALLPWATAQHWGIKVLSEAEEGSISSFPSFRIWRNTANSTRQLQEQGRRLLPHPPCWLPNITSGLVPKASAALREHLLCRRVGWFWSMTHCVLLGPPQNLSLSLCILRPS